MDISTHFPLSPQPFPTGATGPGLEQLRLIASRSNSGKKLSEREIQEVGKQFESLLLHQLLSVMRKSVPKNELFGNSSADRIYEDLFDERIAEQVAAAGQTGIANAIVQEINREQVAKTPPDSPKMMPLKQEQVLFRPVDREAGTWGPVDQNIGQFLPIPKNEKHFKPIEHKEE